MAGAAGTDGDHRVRAAPGAHASPEFEVLIKVFIAEQGAKPQLVANLERIRDGAGEHEVLDAQWAEHSRRC